jgi:hypothetical protein
MTSSNSELLRVANLVYPAGAIGQCILLTGSTTLNLTITTDALTNTITGTAHGLVTGSRVRINSDGTVPGGVAAGVDYYAIALSANQFKLAETLAAAVAGTEINLTDGGTGTVTMNEQGLLVTDAIEVLINKELPSGGVYQRLPITVGAAAMDGVEAVKPPVVVTLNNTGTTDIIYRHVLIAYGAGSAIGSTAGITGFDLTTEGTDQITVASQVREITLIFGAQQAV